MKRTKTKMSRSTLLLVLTTILVGILLAIVLIQKYTTPEAGQPSTPTGNDPIVLSEVDAASITSIVVKKGAEKTAYTYTDKWVLTDDPAHPLDETAMQSFASACAKIVAVTKVRDLDQNAILSIYGLDSPYTVTVTAGDTSYTVQLGSKYSYGNGYYFRMQDTNVLYRMDNTLAIALQSSLSDLTYGIPLPSIAPDTLHTVSLTFGLTDSAQTITYDKDSNTALLSQILTTVSSIDTKLYADAAPTAEKLAEYGLTDDSTRVLTLTVTRSLTGSMGSVIQREESYTYLIGKAVTVNIDGDERVMSYVKLSDQPYVYYLDTTVLD